MFSEYTRKRILRTAKTFSLFGLVSYKNRVRKAVSVRFLEEIKTKKVKYKQRRLHYIKIFFIFALTQQGVSCVRTVTLLTT